MFFRKPADDNPVVHHLNKWRYVKDVEPSRYFSSNSAGITLSKTTLKKMIGDANDFLDSLYHAESSPIFFEKIGNEIDDALKKDKSWLMPITTEIDGNESIVTESAFQKPFSKCKTDCYADIMYSYLFGLHGLLYSAATINNSPYKKSFDQEKLADISRGFKLKYSKEIDLSITDRQCIEIYDNLNVRLKEASEYYKHDYFLRINKFDKSNLLSASKRSEAIYHIFFDANQIRNQLDYQALELDKSGLLNGDAAKLWQSIVTDIKKQTKSHFENALKNLIEEINAIIKALPKIDHQESDGLHPQLFSYIQLLLSMIITQVKLLPIESLKKTNLIECITTTCKDVKDYFSFLNFFEDFAVTHPLLKH